MGHRFSIIWDTERAMSLRYSRSFSSVDAAYNAWSRRRWSEFSLPTIYVTLCGSMGECARTHGSMLVLFKNKEIFNFIKFTKLFIRFTITTLPELKININLDEPACWIVQLDWQLFSY